VTQLLSLMDGLENTEGVVVIGTTNRLDAIDEALRRPGRFDRELYFGPPDAKARREILEIHTREMPLTDEARKNLDRIAQETVGYVSADIMELCREAGLNALRRSLPDQSEAGGTLGIRPHDLTVTSEDFAEALKRVRPSASRLVLTRSTKRTFQDVIGLKAQKQFIREMVIEPMKNPEILRDFDLVSPEGILLYGPPGTGKTWLASSIAGECGINFIAVDGPELFTKWLGESEETVRYVFSLAKRLAPSVLFFDQLDALVPVRSAGNDSLTADRVVSQLLSELDRLQDEPTRIVVVAATNRPDLVDPSILRPGRIGLKLELAKPDFGERAEIVETMLSRIGQAHLPIAEEALKRLGERIAGQTEGFVTSDLIALCRRAKRRVLSSIRHGAENPAGIEELWMKAFMSEAAVKPEHQPIR
jgi:transitional endoplasmic reticulum ATPase